MNVTEAHFRKTLGLFPTGITVITTPLGQDKDIAITISSFTSVSLSPPQILFCLSKSSKALAFFKASHYFAVNILNETQSHLSDGFAQRIPIDWQALKSYRHSPTGCLLITESLGHVICQRGAVYEGGDHEIILGQVIDLVTNPHHLPLVRQKGQYLTTQPLCFEAHSSYISK